MIKWQGSCLSIFRNNHVSKKGINIASKALTDKPKNVNCHIPLMFFFLLTEDTAVGLTRNDSEARSSRNGKTLSERSLIDALSIQDGDSVHYLTDETKSLKSFGSSHGVVRRGGGIDENLVDGVGECGIQDGHLGDDIEHGDDDDGVCGITSDDGGVDGITSDINGDPYGQDGANIDVTNDIPDSGEQDYQHEGTEPVMPTIDVVPATEQQAPHMSLSSLQDEVRLVATAVLSRPKSGRTLAEDAEMATFLLLERMQGLLDPTLKGGSPCSI